MRQFHGILLIFVASVLVACGSDRISQNTAPTAPPRPTPTLSQSATTPVAEPTSAANEPAAPPAANVPLEQIALVAEKVTDQLQQPVYATHAGDGSGRLFVVEKAGTIRVVRDNQAASTPFLTITDRVGSNGSEQGLLSVAFHPNFRENGRLFVDYTDKNGDTVISRFTASGDQADPASETVLMQIDQPYANHNGGLVKFGPDGYLYIGMGDGGSGGDPQGNGQNPNALLGKMLRIDVDSAEPYAIPADNPWAGGNGGAPEAWASGLRNPWRFSFDRATGDLYIADVGQNTYEEVSMLPANNAGGANFGWNVTEASHCFNRSSCDQSQFVAPIDEYAHDLGCSVTGGYVYRGAAFPQLTGTYIFGDYCSGRIWGLRRADSGSWEQRELLGSGLSLSSFGEDEAGELYITDLGSNGLYRLVAQ